MAPKPKSIEERFWPKVKVGGRYECWPWIGARDSDGYGNFRLPGRDGGHTKSHIAAYELTYGQIPIDQMLQRLWVCHECDNPPCCNPDHLFLGRPIDNVRDCIQKGRARRGILKGSQNGNAKLTEAQAEEIKYSESSTKYLAERYGISKSVIQKIRRGESWSHV